VRKDNEGKEITNMPEIGIVANRYTLLLVGNRQQLRLVSWEAIPRIDKTIPFAWEPNAWYRMKLTVTIEGDKAHARGKVWKRTDKEPENWTVEIRDPVPNREGSPALYGYVLGHEEEGDQVVPGTEIYFDNVSVTPNKK